MKDYYFILKISWAAEPREIQSAYYRLARSHHPDVSDDRDATKRMQDINEAYYILKDAAKRERYDAEYHLYREWLKQNAAESAPQSEDASRRQSYHMKDDVLRSWIEEAVSRASELGKQAIRDTGQMATESVKEGAQWLLWGIVAVILMFVMTQCMIQK